jgi:hypothetical protein
MALFTYGTLDVTTWRMDVAAVKNGQAAELYRTGVHYAVHGKPYPAQIMSHPPSILHLLLFWDQLENLTGLPLQFWMRFTCALADVGTVLLLWRLSLRRPGFTIDTKTLVFLAACPISLVISGFHANTDPIMVLFLVASVYFVEARQASIAGLFFALALCIKIVPILFAICFLLSIGGVWTRVRFLVISAVTFVIAGMPYLAHSWRDMVHVFVTFNSQPWWAALLFDSLGISSTAHKVVFWVLTIGLTVFMNISSKRVPLFIQVGAVTALFLAIAPGFSVQYFAWAVPWVACLGAWNAAIYYVLPGAFVTRLYTIWCKGLPWYAADDNSSRPADDGMFVVLFLLAWLAVWWILSMFIRSVARHHPT